MPSSLSGRIAELRNKVTPRLSASELASLSGLTRAHISLIESGGKTNPTVSTITGIAEVFGVSIDWLVSGRGKPPSGQELNASVQAARDRARPTATGTDST